MTEPAPSGGPSPLRVGGLALLGVGAVAAIIGIGTLVSGGGDGSGSQALPSPSPSATSPAEPGAGATPTSGVGVPSFTASPTGAIAAPGQPGDGSGTGTGGGAGTGGGSGTGSGTAGGTGGGTAGAGGGSGTVAKAPVRVYNNSTISGLAARAASDFRTDGWAVEAVANYPFGTIPTSTVYYRPGTSEQAAAETMGRAFGMRVEPRFVGLDDASPGLIAIVTNDYQQR